jgi:hypothetical protein
MFVAKILFFALSLFSLIQPTLAIDMKWKITLGVLGVTVFPMILILCVLDIVNICKNFRIKHCSKNRVIKVTPNNAVLNV